MQSPPEAGLRFSTADGIRFVMMEDPPPPDQEFDGGYPVPNELPIHTVAWPSVGSRPIPRAR